MEEEQRYRIPHPRPFSMDGTLTKAPLGGEEIAKTRRIEVKATRTPRCGSMADVCPSGSSSAAPTRMTTASSRQRCRAAPFPVQPRASGSRRTCAKRRATTILMCGSSSRAMGTRPTFPSVAATPQRRAIGRITRSTLGSGTRAFVGESPLLIPRELSTSYLRSDYLSRRQVFWDRQVP